ncbi:MAG: type II toxin-antitoxin system Phd/YefM family antitoxin [Clostridia bacterium]
MLAVNYSNYRESLKHYCDRVNDEAETLIVTRKAGGNVVMLSEDQYNNLIENLYIRANPANYQNLMASIGQLKSGAYKTRELIQSDDGEDANE